MHLPWVGIWELSVMLVGIYLLSHTFQWSCQLSLGLLLCLASVDVALQLMGH